MRFLESRFCCVRGMHHAITPARTRRAIRCCIVHTCSDLCVSVMLPSNSSVTRPSPSLLPGSDGTPSPAFPRYYETATTAVVSRPVLRFFGVGPGGLEFDFAGSLVQDGKSASCTPGCSWTGGTPLPVLGPKGPTALPSSQRTPVCLCRALRLRPSLGRLAFTAPRCCPPGDQTRRASATSKLSELYHTALALAVYASCRHC